MSYFTRGSLVMLMMLSGAAASCTGDTPPLETATTTPPATPATDPSASAQPDIVWEEAGPQLDLFSATTANGWRRPLKNEETTPSPQN